MNIHRFFLILLVFVIALFAGCSRNESAFASLERSPKLMAEAQGAPMAPEAPLMKESRVRQDSVEAAKPASDITGQRKLIYTASLTVAVENVQTAAKALEAQLATYKAYTASQDWYEASVSYEIKVPVEHFTALLDTLGTAGKIRRKTVQARDVTEYYYDLENRLKNKRILVERYQTYLKNAKNVEELLQVERFLNDATTELESLEGNFRGLVKQIDYATISLTIESQITPTTGLPSLGEQIQNLFASFGNFLKTAVVVVIALAIYGVPLVLLLALLWLLLFGRIGLVKRLFSLVSKK